MARFKTTEGLDTTKLYLLSQYCGRDYIFMRYSGGEWARANGSMKQENGKWKITGDVLSCGILCCIQRYSGSRGRPARLYLPSSCHGHGTKHH